MTIYKILRADEWADLQLLAETAGAPIDQADGFIHFSTAAQLAETARRHFANEVNLTVLAMADSIDPALTWEPSRAGDLFPHLYAPLRLVDVAWARPLDEAFAEIYGGEP